MTVGDLPRTDISFSLEYHHLPFFCRGGTFLRFYTTHHICFFKNFYAIFWLVWWPNVLSWCLDNLSSVVFIYKYLMSNVYLRRELFFYWIAKKEALSFLPSSFVAAATAALFSPTHFELLLWGHGSLLGYQLNLLSDSLKSVLKKSVRKLHYLYMSCL